MYLTHISDLCYHLIWYLGARNIKLSIIESYCLWGVDICICSLQYCFLIYGMFDSATVALNSISPIFFQVKKKVTAPSWVWKYWGFSLCQSSAFIKTFGIRKVRKGEDIFDKKLDSPTQCFRIRPRLQQSFFSNRVYCHIIPHKALFSNKKLERALLMLKHTEPDSISWCLNTQNQIQSLDA